MTKNDFIAGTYQDCNGCMLQRHPKKCKTFRERQKLDTHIDEVVETKVGCGKLK